MKSGAFKLWVDRIKLVQPHHELSEAVLAVHDELSRDELERVDAVVGRQAVAAAQQQLRRRRHAAAPVVVQELEVRPGAAAQVVTFEKAKAWETGFSLDRLKG